VCIIPKNVWNHKRGGSHRPFYLLNYFRVLQIQLRHYFLSARYKIPATASAPIPNVTMFAVFISLETYATAPSPLFACTAATNWRRLGNVEGVNMAFFPCPSSPMNANCNTLQIA